MLRKFFCKNVVAHHSISLKFSSKKKKKKLFIFRPNNIGTLGSKKINIGTLVNDSLLYNGITAQKIIKFLNYPYRLKRSLCTFPITMHWFSSLFLKVPMGKKKKKDEVPDKVS